MSQSTKLKLGTGFVVNDELVSHQGGANDSHPLSTIETGDKHRLYAPPWLGEGFYNDALSWDKLHHVNILYISVEAEKQKIIIVHCDSHIYFSL